MRIIAKNQDVYDLQHSLFDPDRVWVREEETFQIRVNKDTECMTRSIGIRDKDLYGGNRDSILCTPMLIGGSMHWFFWLHMWKDGNFIDLRTFRLDKIQDLLDENNKEMHTGFVGGSLKNVDQLAEILKENSPAIFRMLQSLNRPLVWIKKVTSSKTDDTSYLETVTNFNFLEHKLPWQDIETNLYRLHQTLESYIWGVIGSGEKQTVEMSDLERLKAHGFDEKFSFRNRGK